MSAREHLWACLLDDGRQQPPIPIMYWRRASRLMPVLWAIGAAIVLGLAIVSAGGMR
jgi:peptidoglycan/LPS O-acetylase OafA/YrhL